MLVETLGQVAGAVDIAPVEALWELFGLDVLVWKWFKGVAAFPDDSGFLGLFFGPNFVESGVGCRGAVVVDSNIIYFFQ